MKTSLIIAAILVLHKISKTKGKEKFACPIECPPNVYRPVCSRGKSYANLCILKQEICKGKTAREIYDDVEKCPGYEKSDDASGKSIEAIDKNGVLFRHLTDTPNIETLDSTERPKHSISSVQKSKKSHRKPKTQKDRKSQRSKKTCPTSCLTLIQSLWPFSTLENDFARRCPLQYLLCRPLIPTVSGNFLENCQKPRLNLDPLNEIETPFGPVNVPESVNNFGRLKNLGARGSKRVPVDSMHARNSCRIDCDVNEYRPMCNGNYFFRNECYLKKAFCSGRIDKDVFVGATSCSQVLTNM